MKPLLIIGIGQEFRSDDAVGRQLAKLLQQTSWPGVRVVESTGDGTDLMTLWEGSERVWLLDAVSSGQPVGTLHRLSVPSTPLPSSLFQGSTHHWGVAEAVEMGKVMQTLPAEVELFGIEAAEFSYGVEVSEKVQEARDLLLQELQQRIEKEQLCTK